MTDGHARLRSVANQILKWMEAAKNCEQVAPLKSFIGPGDVENLRSAIEADAADDNKPGPNAELVSEENTPTDVLLRAMDLAREFRPTDRCLVMMMSPYRFNYNSNMNSLERLGFMQIAHQRLNPEEHGEEVS
jgi:hypothetical protein